MRKTFSLQKVNSTTIFFTGPKLAKRPFPGRRGKLALYASATKDASARIYIFDFSVLFIFSQRQNAKRPGGGKCAQKFFHQLCQGRSVCVINATCRACNFTCAAPDASAHPGGYQPAGNVGRCNTHLPRTGDATGNRLTGCQAGPKTMGPRAPATNIELHESKKTGMNIAKQTPYATPAFEIKGSAFTMIVLCLKTGDLLSFERQILSHLARTPDFFNHDPVILDLESVTEDAALNLSSFMQVLTRHKLVPVGVCNGSPEQNQAAIALGLGLFSGFSADAKPAPRPVAAEKEPPVMEHAPFAPTTKIITKPIRTGQQVYAQGGDLVLLGAVNAGAEVLADGNIHVYAPLRGRALAGVKGDTKARIFCHCMEAELVSVAGCYRVIDENLPGDLHGKPVQIYLNGERLMIDPL